MAAHILHLGAKPDAWAKIDNLNLNNVSTADATNLSGPVTDAECHAVVLEVVVVKSMGVPTQPAWGTEFGTNIASI